MKKLFCVLGLSLCVGCATALVRPYIGEQQNWPTASGSIVNVRYDLPIFTSLPPAPYDILAEMRIESPLYAQPEEGHMPLLVKKAKKLGADALMFVDGQIYFAANYGARTNDEEAEGNAKKPTLTQVNRFNPESFKPGVTIVAIKWIGEPPPGLAPKPEPAPAPESPASEQAPMPTEPVAAPEAPAPPPAEAVVPESAPAPEVPPPAEASPAPAPAPEPPPAVTNEAPKEVPPAEAPPAEPPPAEPAPATPAN